MKIKKYGITLERLAEKDIELVRKMRNKKQISSKMFFQEKITKKQQKKWFNSINNIYNYYFIIEYHGKKIGLVHGKVLSFEEKITEGGMFIWDSSIWNTHIPVIVSVCMAEITFLVLKMEKTLAEVRTDNPKAINFNLELGYEIKKTIAGEKKLKMELTRENYFSKARKIREMVKNISKDFEDVSWKDGELPKEENQHLYTGLPAYLQVGIDEKRNEI